MRFLSLVSLLWWIGKVGTNIHLIITRTIHIIRQYFNIRHNDDVKKLVKTIYIKILKTSSIQKQYCQKIHKQSPPATRWCHCDHLHSCPAIGKSWWTAHPQQGQDKVRTSPSSHERVAEQPTQNKAGQSTNCIPTLSFQ